jgi:alpha/beta superfamily hydrolase
VASDILIEQQIEFPGPAGLLEGRLGNESAAKNGAVIALHPHPLYGGSMHNNVAEAIVRAGQSSGLLTLRFNFRGVGRSEGDYSDGTGEEDDVGAALDFLDQSFDIGTKIIAGYSFGAAVALAYCHRPEHRADDLLLVSPPPFLLPKGLSLEASVVRKIIVGEQDEIAPPQEIKARVSAKRVKELVEIMPGADHSFWGREKELEDRLKQVMAHSA